MQRLAFDIRSAADVGEQVRPEVFFGCRRRAVV
jgi:hypothetical protein